MISSWLRFGFSAGSRLLDRFAFGDDLVVPCRQLRDCVVEQFVNVAAVDDLEGKRREAVAGEAERVHAEACHLLAPAARE